MSDMKRYNVIHWGNFFRAIRRTLSIIAKNNPDNGKAIFDWLEEREKVRLN